MRDLALFKIRTEHWLNVNTWKKSLKVDKYYTAKQTSPPPTPASATQTHTRIHTHTHTQIHSHIYQQNNNKQLHKALTKNNNNNLKAGAYFCNIFEDYKSKA